MTPVPAQQRLGPRWQGDSADTIYQSLSLMHRDRPGLVVVCGADHVYRMEPDQIIQAHPAWGAGVTVAAIPVPRTAATDFGVTRAAAGGYRIEAFQESPMIRRACRLAEPGGRVHGHLRLRNRRPVEA